MIRFIRSEITWQLFDFHHRIRRFKAVRKVLLLSSCLPAISFNPSVEIESTLCALLFSSDRWPMDARNGVTFSCDIIV
jgi:hypothetical protein